MPQSHPRHPPQHVKLAKHLQQRLQKEQLDPPLRRFLQAQLKLVRNLAKLPSPPQKPSLPAHKGSPPHGQTPHTANINLKNPPPEASVSKQADKLLAKGRQIPKLRPYRPPPLVRSPRLR